MAKYVVKLSTHAYSDARVVGDISENGKTVYMFLPEESTPSLDFDPVFSVPKQIVVDKNPNPEPGTLEAKFAPLFEKFSIVLTDDKRILVVDQYYHPRSRRNWVEYGKPAVIFSSIGLGDGAEIRWKKLQHMAKIKPEGGSHEKPMKNATAKRILEYLRTNIPESE